ncbi:MAG: hypothetical protein ABWY55_04995 [Microbacterium sp.]
MVHTRNARPSIATIAIGALLVAGAVTAFPAAVAPAAAEPLPGAPETFDVSRSAEGEATDVFLMADAQRAVFASTAGDLVPGDTNSAADIFLTVAQQGSDDPFSGQPTLVSVPDGPVGAQRANGASSDPVASIDGRYVAFRSTATNLVDLPSTGDGRGYIYVRDTVAERTFRIQGDDEPNADSRNPDLSDDGRHLVFTTDADNYTPGDVNLAADSYLVDLDPDLDGILNARTITKLFPSVQIPTGTHDAVISGNGYLIAFLSRVGPTGQGTPMALDALWSTNLTFDRTASYAERVVSPPSIDATGKVVAFISDDGCGDSRRAVVASSLSAAGSYSVALGRKFLDTDIGTVADAEISPDGSTVAWSTTVPERVTGATELATPVVRMQRVSWEDAIDGGMPACDASYDSPWYEVAEGREPSLSAAARTIAFETPSPSRIVAVDTHATDGISVTSAQGRMLPPTFNTEMPISSISLATLRGYAATLADSPVHRLPVHRLPVHRLPVHRLPVHRLLVVDSPVHRLPVHRLPVHRLPVHRLDIPGGWTQLLAATPFAADPLQSVTLDAVLAWAAEAISTDSTATAAERAAAELIQSLTLGDIDIDGSGLDALSLASYALGNALLGDLPLPGTGPNPSAAENRARWQEVATEQGLDVEIDSGMVLADLDAAGIDIASTGVEQIVLSDLADAVIDDTLLGWMTIDPDLLPNTPLGAIAVEALDAAARTALFGRTDVTGTLAAPSAPLLETATFADLVKGSTAVTFGDVLFSLLDAASYPWEQISPTSLDPRLATASSNAGTCHDNTRCSYDAPFRFTFDVGPGEPTGFTAPTASITLPAETALKQFFASGSGPGLTLTPYDEYRGPRSTRGQLVSVPLPDTRAGTVVEFAAWYSDSWRIGNVRASAELTTGSLRATAELTNSLALAAWDDPDSNRTPDGDWVSDAPNVLREGRLYYEFISPAWLDTDDFTGEPIQGPAADEDFFLVAAPPPGERLVVSTNAQDGQIALALYSGSTAGTSAASLGVASAGEAPGTVVVEQSSAAGAPAESGADGGTPVTGQNLIDQAVQRGDGTTQVEAASTDALNGQNLLVRVTSGNGKPSAELYSLRVSYVDEAAETVCTSRPLATGAIGTSDPVTDDTNTIYVLDSQRYAQTYGEQGLADVREALSTLTGTGRVGTGTVQGAVISVDASQEVRDMRDILDANPCSMEARRQVTAAINQYVASQLEGHRDHIASVVVVGADDIIPFAPVAQHTSQFTEVSHATELRLDSPPGGAADDPCPVIPQGEIDPCETPLSAAASGGYILTDDPYGLASAYESLGGYLYVPTVALGRLVETPAQIVAATARFEALGGVLAADSTATGGYGAWAELPEEVTTALAWRSTGDTALGSDDPEGRWDRADMADALFPDGEDSPRLVSINTHADETRMLPGIPGAESGSFKDADLFTAAQASADAPRLDESLVFLIGCHAGNNLPSAYYGPDAVDWVDVFAQGAGYVGNTGYGLANNTTMALGERLLDLYADWIGVTVDGGIISTSQSLTYAKQSYLGGLGLYSGYDEKVLMGAVYYGLPMYTVAPGAGDPKDAPVPSIPDGLSGLQTAADGLSAASLTLTPQFLTRTLSDPSGPTGSYYVADGQDPAIVAGQPVLPKIVTQLRSESPFVPKGVLITALTSQFDDDLDPLVAQAGVGVDETAATRSDSAFPSTFATITRQETPDGPVDLLVVTPGRAESWADGQGRLEKFTDMGLDILYVDGAVDDSTPPVVSAIEQDRGRFRFAADAKGGEIARVVLLIQREGETAWEPLEVSRGDSTWSAALGDDPRPFRWILQVADDAGNVTTETARGHFEEFRAEPPTLGDQVDETVEAGARLQRVVEVGDVDVSDRLSAKVTVTTPASSNAVTSGSVPISTGDDGITRARIDQLFTTPGEYDVALEVCRGDACAQTSFSVVVPIGNHPPTSTVSLSADTPVTRPDSVLTATAVGADEDHHDLPVDLEYEWYRNGVKLPSSTTSTLSLSEIGALEDDSIRVVVTPFDAAGPGHSSAAEVRVGPSAVLPPEPTIVATATTADGPYVDGTWSGKSVTVSFSCTGHQLLSCSDPVTVSAETPIAGVVVEGTARDGLGRETGVGVLVKLDLTPPTLAPTATPSTVPLGEPVVVVANAMDAASGIASEACDVPGTASAGTKTATCRATDAAGNTAEATIQFTVQAPPPAPPTIAVTATAGGIPYVPGTWSRVPVALAYTCTSGVAVTSCQAPRTITADTGPAGQTVTGTVTDALGRTAQTSILVKVDRTAPRIAPTATPSSVTVGATVVLSPNATDAGSGVASQSCDGPNTMTVGTKTATCRATDVAGNAATGTATYVVTAPVPPRCQGVADRTPLVALNPDGSSVFLRTSGVPIVFRACDASGTSIGTKGFVTGTTLLSTENLASGAKVNEIWYPPIGGFTYVKAAKTWIGHIPTAQLVSGKKYTYRVALADGTSFTVTFGVR